MRRLVVAMAVLLVMVSFTGIKTAKIGIDKGELIINKKCFGSSWMLHDFERCMGEAPKKKDGYNRTHTYDNMGIILYEKKKDTVLTGKISEVQIYFDPSHDRNERTPESAYSGFVKVENLKAQKNLTSASMKQSLPGWIETESFSPHNYRMVKGSMYIYFKFNDQETELQKMSIGYAMY